MDNKDNLAFVFPGQGSQRVGMLAELAARYPVVEQTFAEASEVLGYDLWRLVQEGPEEALALTERTQPMLLAASTAVWRVWNERGGARPAWLAGHSLGEWSALVAAEVVDFPAAVQLVRLRGAYMQEAVPPGEGAMAAVMGVAEEEVERVCAEVAGDQVVAAVNYNSPGQVVIAGHAPAVARALEALRAAGARRAVPLPVSAPFHTSLMRPAAERLAREVRATPFRAPRIPVIHNVHAAPEADPEAIKELVIEQIHRPVLWVDCVRALAERGVEILVECGPGRVLQGLVRRIDRSLAAYAADEPAALEEALGAVCETLGEGNE
ncbi:MAG: malonyl CoA-acyl carrier protein transacylase [Porticoccaceae bacterium]|nr:MAG: malonyl CoA-acyl carrier protein transacylase [Porticoccaceae bacterium]